MFKGFKLRLLLVIFIVAVTGWAMQSGNQSRDIIEPVLRYVLRDYGVDKKIANLWENMHSPQKDETLPVTTNSTLQLPCEFISIERSFGWYWNEDDKKQAFSPGVDLKVKENTLVMPVLDGQVEEITGGEDARNLLIKHNENLYSYYGGLKEILVDQGAEVNNGQVLGKSSAELHLEIRNQEGPLNPNQLFE